MLKRLNCWLSLLISLILVMLTYFILPSIIAVLTEGSLKALLSFAVLLPVAIILGLSTFISVLSTFIKCVFSKKWYLITLGVILLILALITALTSAGLIGSVL